MLQQLAQGWSLVRANRRTFFIVSLYQLLWTVSLYLLISNIVTPIVRALPSGDGNTSATQYFWLEARFLAAKTDLLLPYIYLFIGLLLLRMIISPIIQSGIYGVLAKSKHKDGNNKFASTLKESWKPFVIVYWTKILAIAVPLVLLVYPLIQPTLNHYFSLPKNSISVFLFVLLALWILLVSSLSYGFLIGLVNKLSWTQSFSILLKQALRLMSIALMMLAITLIVQSLFQLTSLYVFGMVSTILFFILPIIRTFLKAWTISTHMIQFE